MASIEELVSALRAALARIAGARAALLSVVAPIEAAGHVFVELGPVASNRT